MLSKDVKARIARNKRRRIAMRTKDGRSFDRARAAAAPWNIWKSPFSANPWLKELIARSDELEPIPTGFFNSDILKGGFKRGELIPLMAPLRPSQGRSDLFGSMLRQIRDPALQKRLAETIVIFPQEQDAQGRFMTLTRGKRRGENAGAFKIDLEKPWDIVEMATAFLGGDIVDIKTREEAERRVQEELTQNPDLVLSPMSDIHLGDMKRGMNDGTVSFTTLDSYSSFEDESNDDQSTP